ncbi:hypothetical protein BpHYR1_024234 [Brachionus plicatilis]|uniref:Uncharacterized protein n=1 Tax=Brachionus plicatilis TaxID=10195 RepID=A0A3M7R8Z8_BRAPC|nr:hypothetical protein BpHYR1_024234 [Brachionus plicatilis]
MFKIAKYIMKKVISHYLLIFQYFQRLLGVIVEHTLWSNGLFLSPIACFAFAGLPGFLFSPLGIFFADNGYCLFYVCHITCLMTGCFLCNHCAAAVQSASKPILNWRFDLHRRIFESVIIRHE